MARDDNMTLWEAGCLFMNNARAFQHTVITKLSRMEPDAAARLVTNDSHALFMVGLLDEYSLPRMRA